jgi:2-polyprenyl-3-methyl-5-hydroxy-6-metoxy-1,4-benzoquinol methylase
MLESMQMNFFPKENAKAKRLERLARTTKSCTDFEYDYFDNNSGEYGYAYGGYHDDGRFNSSVRKLMTFFRIRMGQIQRNKGIKQHVMDYGCAKGYLLAEFRREGIDHITGYDVSKYAIDNAHPLVKDDLKLIVPGEEISHSNGEFSFVICKEVLPYVPEDKIVPLIMDLDRWSRGCYIYTYAVDDESMVDKLYQAESLLKTIKPSEWWRNAFKEAEYSGEYYIESIF